MPASENYEVRIVANPMAGRDEPVLGALAAAFADSPLRWNIDVTNEPGEESELATRAVAEGASIVVAFGGDGTVSAVAGALANSDVALGVLPGGTANVFARELGIPSDLGEAAKLIAGPHEVRTIDMGVVRMPDGSSRTFVLRVSTGIEATMVENAEHAEKERLGELAYMLSTIRQLPNAPVAHYRVANENGEVSEADGLFAGLVNASAVGIGEAVYSADVRIDDGQLDAFVAPAAVGELASAAAAVVSGAGSDVLMQLSGTRLELTADPPQRVSVDGEVAGDTPVTVEVLAGALKVVAPASDDKAGA